MMPCGSSLFSSRAKASPTLLSGQCGLVPPTGSTMCASGLPRECTIAVVPCFVSPKKHRDCRAAAQASTAAAATSPDGLANPTGIDRPLAMSRCRVDSQDCAPMPPQATRSAKNCGVAVSKKPTAQGMPKWLISCSSFLLIRRPVLTMKDWSSAGSKMRPFQSVARGGSKNIRMTRHKSPASLHASAFNRCAYSSAALGSCTQHGPMITTSRSSSPWRIACTSERPRMTVALPSLVMGSSAIRSCGLITARTSRILRLSTSGSAKCSVKWPASRLARFPGRAPSSCRPSGRVLLTATDRAAM
mmetsp:Transcript_3227/g.9276  ORF Transcript_3227/g.9276 Transcript_3227/m.9276 type:complete len:302 (+) Transcript_3227:441-1346(+)